MGDSVGRIFGRGAIRGIIRRELGEFANVEICRRLDVRLGDLSYVYGTEIVRALNGLLYLTIMVHDKDGNVTGEVLGGPIRPY